MAFKDLTEVSSNRIKFVIDGVDLSIVNAVRRIILAEIPTAAFYFDSYDIENNSVKITTNTGVLHNEFLAHRISLVPLCFTENQLENFDPAKFKFVLKKKNTTASDLLVTTGDFLIVNDNGEAYPNSVREQILPKNTITNSHIVITKLKPNLYDISNGEELDLECIPSLNIAKEHARWCPVSQATYFNNIDDKLSKEAFEAKVEEYKKQKKNVSQSDIVELRSKFDSLDCHRHFKRNKYDEACEFTFLIESECGLRPSYLFFKALSILTDKLKKLASTLEAKTGEPDISLSQIGQVNDFYQLKVKNEDHTLFNVLQCMIYNQQFRQSQSTNLAYIGYYQPHPHDNIMYLKLKFIDDTKKIDLEYARSFLIDNINKVTTTITNITKDWVHFSNLNKTDIEEIKKFQSNL